MTKKRTILHLIPNISLGGAEKVVLGLCKGMNKSLFNPHVAYWQDKEDILDSFRDNDIPALKLNLIKTASLNSVITVIKLLKDIKADILHTHFIDSDLLGFLASRLTMTPMVIHIHSYPFPEKGVHKIRYKTMATYAKKIICVSNVEKEYLAKNVGIKDEKINVVYNGIDTDRFALSLSPNEIIEFKKSLGIDSDKKIICNVSRLVPEKCHKCLIKAFGEVIKLYPKVHLMIVGNGPLRYELMDLCGMLGLGENVTFLGLRTDIPELLKISDIFAFPGLTEAMGISVLEAMAAAKPVVASNDGGIPELITNEKEGLLMPPNDEEALTRNLLFLLEKSLFAREMGIKGAKKAEYFTERKMINDTEDLYLSICPSKKRRFKK